ncbi:MFS transporter [Candidatus Nitrosocosmicus arcticus]|uniref:MFS family permease n=1 Tax=Candidatus Nitrosocosmicus arcticus TaxID=2035267 RepID=A0A557SZI2_9ARCH|nr:MFS transporter [Candidatus Nitrosocosmicus arcticus]TVP42011.1 MFS family permease [Candidatus Nitrosocosmicus arcticus]
MNEKNSQKDAWIALAILSSLALITMYGETMLIPAIPYLIDDFKISYNTSSWILTAYLIAGAVMTPIIGKLSDIYGKKKILMNVIVIYSLGSLLGGLSNDIFMMIISRVIQGIGLAMFPVAFAIIREKFPPEKLAIGQGIFTAVFSAGAVVGLGLGATIVEYFSWHMTFLSIVPLMIILLIVVLRGVRIDSEKLITRIRASIDITGTLVLVGIVSTFLTGLTLLPNSISGPNNNHLGIILALFVISIALLPLFIFTQKRAQSPIIDLSLLKDIILFPTNILIMSIGAAFFIIYQTLPILIQSPTPLGFGGGPVATASVQLPFMVLSFVISVLSGFLISKIGNIKPTLIGSIISTFGFILLSIYHPSELVISLELCIIAIGLAFAEIGAFNISLVSAPLNQSGTALGITMLLFLIGMSLGPAISGIYLESFRSTVDNTNESYPTSLAYDLIFVTAVLISILSVILTLFITKKLVSKTI